MSRRRPHLRATRWIPVLLLTLLLHLLAGWGGGQMLPYFGGPTDDAIPISLVVLQPPEDKDDEEDPDDEDDDPEVDGQIVETAKPKDPIRPEDADYLAEYDMDVEEETRSERFEINPDVVAPEWSKEQKLEYEDLSDVNVDQPSTGATVGNDRFDPDRDGSLAALQSPWLVTNKDGIQDPVPASHLAALLAGAPQNDLVDEERGDQLLLDTKEFKYAAYLLRIRRLVNFYWEQNLDNLPHSVVIAKPRYTTDVEVVLDSNGALELVEITDASGVTELDDAVLRAFRMAGPFPNPPEGLVEKDGRVYLPEMSWTVQFTAAQNHYEGIDPNAGRQFPGILKSPR